MTAPFVRTDPDGRWASLAAYAASHGVDPGGLPRSVRVLLEAALVGLAEGRLDAAACETILGWRKGAAGAAEWRFPVGRVLMQDASGLPLLADLAALRDAVAERGGDAAAIGLATPAALVIDHAIDADHWGAPDALARNMAAEFDRNAERYAFARWAAQAFDGLQIVPPGNGIVHQVHLERLAQVVADHGGWTRCDTVIGTDSHTTMVGGLGVVGWGVGGIEAEAALLGRPVSIASPEIVGVELTGAPRPGVFAADLALALTARLRGERVVGAFLEFYGEGVGALGVADRCTIANMAPEYGATMALFPVDEAVLGYLADHGRDAAHIDRIRTHLTRQGLFGGQVDPAAYDRLIRFDLSEVAAVVAGPSRPDQAQALADVPRGFAQTFADQPRDGRVVLAAITSCTNTANLRSVVAAGLLARKAVAAGLTPPAWVKTVFAPGSRATTDALEQLGLLAPLEALGFHVAAYGCGPCVGNTGDLASGVEAELAGGAAAAVLSGNRNFEGRIHHAVRAAYLMNPALVVAYALAGRIDVDLTAGEGGFRLADLWPSETEIAAELASLTRAPSAAWIEPALWSEAPAPRGARFAWSPGSSFFVRPPFFDAAGGSRLADIAGAAPLLVLGDAVTTDHISPVGAIKADSAAARYLAEHGVPAHDVGTYSARRVNHPVMLRGTFANPRLRNRLVDAVGPVTRTMGEGGVAPIHEVAADYRAQGRACVVLAGRDYGAGSARDWAAKGTALLGVRAVLARSFERIHRSNLVALGVLPIEIPGDADPWADIGPASQVSASVDLGEARPNGAVTIELVVDGHTQRLAGVLRVATTSERDQLARGDLFALCLGEALREGAGA